VSTYSFRDAAGDVVLSAPEFARPIPVHAQRPEALAAVARMRTAADAERRARVVAGLVTGHGRPAMRAYRKPPPAGYERVKRLAEENGWTVTEYTSPTGHALQGRRGELGFRAFWHHGKTVGATWHEKRERWALITDDREVKMNTRDRVGRAGYRTEGVDRIHLSLLATPHGLPINVTTLEERISA
jgi:hypothetical protein